MHIDRRKFLQLAGAAAATLSSPQLLAKTTAQGSTHSGSQTGSKPGEIEASRRLNLLNWHTGERANVIYWEQGQYLVDGLAEIYLLMRDHHQDLIAPIDVRLLDQLYRVNHKLDNQKEVLMLSGYRSPKTNEQLRRNSEVVAKNSLHMKGEAIDFLLPDVSLKHLHKATLAVCDGGVGYYERNGFIHMDIGRKRQWSY